MASDVTVETTSETKIPAFQPVDLKTVFLGGLFTIAVLGCCYILGSIILPVILACILKLLFQPAMRRLEGFHIPRAASAALLTLLLLGMFAGLGAALSVPAKDWAARLPSDLPKLQTRINMLSAPLKPIQKILHRAEGLTAPQNTPNQQEVVPVVVQKDGLSDRVLASTRSFASGLFEMVLVLFFLLISGDTFLRRLVEVLPRFHDKKQAIMISAQIESNVAAYLMTITCMNLAVGVATGLVMAACHIADPLLWGTIAFLLNYVPIVGPLVGAGLFVLVGMMTSTDIGPALLPAALYLGIHMLEGEFITPLLLARRFVLNPVLIILSLIFWYWMWGIAGAVLAMPMLAIIKIICDGIESLKPFGHFIEG